MLRAFLTSSLDADGGRCDAPVALSRLQNPSSVGGWAVAKTNTGP
jgi:hypothetical protein